MDKIKQFILKNKDDKYYQFISFFLIGLLVYLPSLLNQNFFWDDERFIFLNPQFANAPSWIYFWNVKSELFKVWPFGYTVFWFVIKYLPTNPVLTFKFINVFFHSLNAFLLLNLFKKLRIPYAWPLSIVFFVHPLNVESVSWIFQLLTILSFTFFIASLQTLYFFLKSNKLSLVLFSFILFSLSLLTKGIALLAPFLFLGLFVLMKVKPRKYLVLIPFFISSLVLGVLTQKGTEDLSQTDKSPATVFIEDLFNLKVKEKPKMNEVVNEEYANFIFKTEKKADKVVFSRIAVFSQAMIHYPLKLIVPFGLHFIYKEKKTSLVLAIIVAILLIASFVLLYKKADDKKILFTLLYFAIFLIPYLGITFITFFYWSSVSDRYTYYIVPAYALLIGLIIKRWENPYAIKALMAYVITLLFLNIYHGNQFNNLLALYKDTLTQKDHPAMYSLLFEQYLYKLDLPNSEAVLNEGVKKYPHDERLKMDMLRLESLRSFYKN